MKPFVFPRSTKSSEICNGCGVSISVPQTCTNCLFLASLVLYRDKSCKLVGCSSLCTLHKTKTASLCVSMHRFSYQHKTMERLKELYLKTQYYATCAIHVIQLTATHGCCKENINFGVIAFTCIT